MFDIGPEKLVVLLIVALIVLGPDRLPQLARDAARMLRTLRELSRDTRAQLNEHLGPELRDLADLNPRTLLQRALLDDDDAPTAGPPAAPGPHPGPAPAPGRRPAVDDEAT